jgi:hypothetical protein
MTVDVTLLESIAGTRSVIQLLFQSYKIYIALLPSVECGITTYGLTLWHQVVREASANDPPAAVADS